MSFWWARELDIMLGFLYLSLYYILISYFGGLYSFIYVAWNSPELFDRLPFNKGSILIFAFCNSIFSLKYNNQVEVMFLL